MMGWAGTLKLLLHTLVICRHIQPVILQQLQETSVYLY